MYSLFAKAEARMPQGTKRPVCGTGVGACGQRPCINQAPAHVAAINARDPKGVPGF